MSKIYDRRAAAEEGGNEKKKKNRVRNVIMNFRVTPKEKEMIENRIKLSGLSKQEYFIRSCTEQKLTVIGNVKTFDAIRNEMKVIDEHLLQIKNIGEADENCLTALKNILDILSAFYGEESLNGKNL